MNHLSEEIITEVENGMKDVRDDPAITSIVLMSGKPENFIAGADIK